MAHHTCIILLGSNYGHKLEYINEALKRLEGIVRFEAVSGIYDSPAFGGGEPYLNCVVIAKTLLTHEELVGRAKELEHILGRDNRMRKMKWVPIDIDIMEYDNQLAYLEEQNRPYYIRGLSECRVKLGQDKLKHAGQAGA